jgi:hypothetical protein
VPQALQFEKKEEEKNTHTRKDYLIIISYIRQKETGETELAIRLGEQWQ